MVERDPAGAGARAPARGGRWSRWGRSRWLRAALVLTLVVGLVLVVDGVRRHDGAASAASADRADGAASAASTATPTARSEAGEDAPQASGPPRAALPEGDGRPAGAPSGPVGPSAAPSAPSGTPSEAPSDAPGIAATDVPAAPGAPVGVETLPPVGVGDAVALGTLETTVVSVEEVRVRPNGPGEVAGPATAVGLRVRNTSKVPVDLTGLAVTASSRDGGTPAVPAGGDPARPLAGALAPGRERSGTYVFVSALPGAAAAAPLRVEVGLDTARGVASVLTG